jgi:uncharacterized membrane protein
VEAFSDGVFSIAITLLALNMKVPGRADLAGMHATLSDALLAQWPAYLAYVISFVAVLIMWVTLVPFPTAMLAEYINHP